MSFASRIKIVRDYLGKSQKEMAILLDASLSAVQSYESGRQKPGGKVFETLANMGFDTNWLLTGQGEMRREEVSGHVANGNNIIQGSHIDAEEVHMMVHAADPGQSYGDPINALFVKDWKRLSEAGQMRVWTLLKEEIERERGK